MTEGQVFMEFMISQLCFLLELFWLDSRNAWLYNDEFTFRETGEFNSHDFQHCLIVFVIGVVIGLEKSRNHVTHYESRDRRHFWKLWLLNSPVSPEGNFIIIWIRKTVVSTLEFKIFVFFYQFVHHLKLMSILLCWTCWPCKINIVTYWLQ